MSTVQPDREGFADAQRQLRANFGRDIRFFRPATMLYDPSVPVTAFDDEGFPLDPLVGASAIASADVSIENLTYIGHAKGNVVFRPLQTSILRRDQTFETPLAIRGGLNRDLILDVADYGVASGATHYQVGTLARDAEGNVIEPEEWTPLEEELWKVVTVKADTFGAVPRLIVYGQGTL